SRAQPPQIHDSFPGPRINPTIWHGSDSPGDAGTSNVEVVRVIYKGQLLLSLTSYGKTDSDAGHAGIANNRLGLNNPADLTVLFAKVTVQQAIAQPCTANSTDASNSRV